MTARGSAVFWLWAVLAGYANAAVTFDDAWIRAARPGSAVAAGYCTITNTGPAPVAIVAFVGSERVEMHESTMVDGMSRMRPLKQLTIAVGEVLKLARGGKHLMLFDLDSGVRQTTLRALLADGTSVPVTFTVKPWQQP